MFLFKLTQNEELKKIQKILKNYENRIKKLEGKEVNSEQKHSRKKKPESIMDFLMELKQNNFFNKPKFLKEIMAELAKMGHHYQITSLTEPIQRAVRQRKLGRIGKTGKWQYVSR